MDLNLTCRVGRTEQSGKRYSRNESPFPSVTSPFTINNKVDDNSISLGSSSCLSYGCL